MRRAIVVSLTSLAFGFAALGAEEKSCGACPVSGKPAKKDQAVDYKGKQVYFCCGGCPAAFKKDPEKFAAKANQQLLVSGQIVQVGCPLSGGPLKKTADIAGASVGFCCDNCKGKVESSDDPVKMVFASLKGFTLQTECPVSGKPINAKISTEHAGKKVYFCCAGCPDAFKAEPDKFLSKLPK